MSATAGQSKITTERNAKLLLELVMQPGNDACADCKSRSPRWASHNLGIFICVSCASIHRKIGTHVTKVKSLTLDSWTKEQVEIMKANGNVRSNEKFNPNTMRNPPPTNIMESERNNELEQFIRSKYEYKRFMDRSALVASQLGPSQSLASRLTRPKSAAPLSQPTPPVVVVPAPPAAAKPPMFSNTLEYRPSSAAAAPITQPTRSISQAAPPTRAATMPMSTPAAPVNPVWDDLVSLQTPATNPSYALQYNQQPAPFNPGPMANNNTGYIQPQQTSFGAPNPFHQQQLTTSMYTGATPFNQSAAGPSFTSGIQQFQPTSAFGQQQLGVQQPQMGGGGYSPSQSFNNPVAQQQQQQTLQQFFQPQAQQATGLPVTQQQYVNSSSPFAGLQPSHSSYQQQQPQQQQTHSAFSPGGAFGGGQQSPFGGQAVQSPYRQPALSPFGGMQKGSPFGGQMGMQNGFGAQGGQQGMPQQQQQQQQMFGQQQGMQQPTYVPGQSNPFAGWAQGGGGGYQ